MPLPSDMAGRLFPLHTNYLALHLIPRAELHSRASLNEAMTNLYVRSSKTASAAANPVTIVKTYVALLRAVNVGGTGRLPMSTLKQMCEEVGLRQVRTYIASGNIVFKSDTEEAEIKSALEGRLQAYAGKPVGVLVRLAGEMAAVLARNPFQGEPGNRTVALFVDDPLPADALDHATGLRREQLRLGKREIYIFYGDGMANSRLRIPAANAGTARNMNTIAKLVEMATAL
jgi:uncharacterized protein (DUF1697 family)